MSETGSENDVTHIEEGTVNIESVSLRDTDLQSESRANEDAILSRDEAVSRDVGPDDTPPLEGIGAKPKTTKILQRKNTPAVLPKVDSLYSSLRSSFISSTVHTLFVVDVTLLTHIHARTRARRHAHTHVYTEF